MYTVGLGYLYDKFLEDKFRFTSLLQYFSYGWKIAFKNPIISYENRRVVLTEYFKKKKSRVDILSLKTIRKLIDCSKIDEKWFDMIISLTSTSEWLSYFHDVFIRTNR